MFIFNSKTSQFPSNLFDQYLFDHEADAAAPSNKFDAFDPTKWKFDQSKILCLINHSSQFDGN